MRAMSVLAQGGTRYAQRVVDECRARLSATACRQPALRAHARRRVRRALIPHARCRDAASPY